MPPGRSTEKWRQLRSKRRRGRRLVPPMWMLVIMDRIRSDRAQLVPSMRKHVSTVLASFPRSSLAQPSLCNTWLFLKVVDTDEHPRPVAADKMAALRPVFKKDGVVTAANASGICDGAGRQVLLKQMFSFGDHVVGA